MKYSPYKGMIYLITYIGCCSENPGKSLLEEYERCLKNKFICDTIYVAGKDMKQV
jgi:hypothetical protein